MYQTNLTVTYSDFSTRKFENVHPDNEYRIEGGLMSFETLDGSEIVYIPADGILYFSTTCEKVGA